jgi:hypothetical protein
MIMPGRQRKLEQLKEILATGAELFSRMREAEQQLQDQLISGRIASEDEADDLRRRLAAEAATLEEKRRVFLPPGMSLRRYITTRVSRSEQEVCLAGLTQIEAELQKLTALHTVNRTLLEQRIRYIRELEQLCYPLKSSYDQKGQLKGGSNQAPPNLDRSC